MTRCAPGLVCAVVALSAAAVRPVLAAPPVNTMCPVMTEEPVDPDITLEFRGVTIGFCCDRCVRKFQENPERYLAALPATVFDRSTDDAEDGADRAATADAAPPGTPRESDGRADADVPLLGRLHPAIVHLPIAGLPLALLSLVVWKARGREQYARADVIPLLAAAAGSVAAVYSGDTAEEFLRFSAQQRVLVERHELLAQIVMYSALALCALRLWRWSRLSGAYAWVYAAGLVGVSGLVLATGYFGGSLVFGPEHFAW